MKRFDGRCIVITGAGGGLGFAYAQRLGAEGATVIIAEINADLGRRAESLLRAAGLSAVFIETDVTAEASLEAMAVRARELSNGGIDGLVTNAGWANAVGGRLYHELPVDDWDKMMAINVRGTWLTVKTIGPRMKDGGSIVTVSSDSIFWGAPALLHYMTSKAAVAGMTRSLARELGERNIRVNCIAPGLTKVEATKNIAARRWQDYAERKILKRDQWPSDLDGVVAFLLSDDASFITGQLLAVDGGFALH
jgi:NAD(P)-dependent dehydrogenase (short-subunit alcohol dehydrogenase family)